MGIQPNARVSTPDMSKLSLKTGHAKLAQVDSRLLGKLNDFHLLGWRLPDILCLHLPSHFSGSTRGMEQMAARTYPCEGDDHSVPLCDLLLQTW